MKLTCQFHRFLARTCRPVGNWGHFHNADCTLLFLGVLFAMIYWFGRVETAAMATRFLVCAAAVALQKAERPVTFPSWNAFEDNSVHSVSSYLGRLGTTL